MGWLVDWCGLEGFFIFFIKDNYEHLALQKLE